MRRHVEHALRVIAPIEFDLPIARDDRPDVRAPRRQRLSERPPRRPDPTARPHSRRGRTCCALTEARAYRGQLSPGDALSTWPSTRNATTSMWSRRWPRCSPRTTGPAGSTSATAIPARRSRPRSCVPADNGRSIAAAWLALAKRAIRPGHPLRNDRTVFFMVARGQIPGHAGRPAQTSAHVWDGPSYRPRRALTVIANCAISRAVNRRHRATLIRIFARQVPADLAWRDIEALFRALGATIRERQRQPRAGRAEGDRHRVPSAAPRAGDEERRGARGQSLVEERGSEAMTLEYKGYTAGRGRLRRRHLLGHRRRPARRHPLRGHHGRRARAGVPRQHRLITSSSAPRLGRSPDKPYSGHVMIRIDPALHRKAAQRAEAEDISLNAWIAKQIDAA